MFKHSVEVKLSYVETKERNKKGNLIKRPVIHRKMQLDGTDPIQNIRCWRIVARRRKVPLFENGNPVMDDEGKQVFFSEACFSTSYLPLTRSSYWEPWVQGVKWVREKEPSGKITPQYDLEGIERWLSFRVADPVACLNDLLTAMPVKESDEYEEAA